MRMIKREGPLSLSRQCGLLGVSRSSLYYRPRGESAENLALMRRMDELHVAHPFYGSRQMMRHLRLEGVKAGRHRVRRLMRLMGMEATYRRPRTSAGNKEHRVLPYLLRGIEITRADHVYLHELCDGLDAERVVGSWIDFYNEVRPHSVLGGATPATAYRERREAA